MRSRCPAGLLGLVGAPGAGKSTLAAALASAVPGAVVVPMDGFHLTTARLREMDRVEQRGAPDTFDADGYVTLLRRIHTRRRAGRAGAGLRTDPSPKQSPMSSPSPRTRRWSAPEGNYLLLDSPPWTAVPSLLDETWFVDVPEALRVERLVARFVAFGLGPHRCNCPGHRGQ